MTQDKVSVSPMSEREKKLEAALKAILKARQVSHCKHIAKQALS